MTTFTLPRIDQDLSQGLENAGFGALQATAGNLPLKQLGYKTQITGLATRTTIVQTFYNPFDECIEATYVFPIEGEQAVVDCEMRVEDRVIRAHLKEREQARSDYRQALAQGHRAALLEENRPETFSMKVGNIAPGEVVQTRIETVGLLPVVDGEWTLRLPLVVAPRYTSGFPVRRNSIEGGIHVDTNQVPDASAITPPTWLPGFASPVDLRLEVDVQMGSLANGAEWLSGLRSSLHSVVVQRQGDQNESPKSCLVSVRPGERVDRDFILRGKLDSKQIATSLVVTSVEDAIPSTGADDTSSTESENTTDSTFALHLVPPPCESRTPRDVVFVLDRSGSMGGWKMEAAKRGICRLVDSLGPQDRFQVIAFDNRVESPTFPSLNNSSWVPASDSNRFKAVQWLGKIDARGGTEMGMALKQALQSFQEESDTSLRSRAVVLVTDGHITGEDSVLRLLGTLPDGQRPRLFCLGIDRAVNGSVLQRLAKASAGTYELVESEKRLDEVMHRFGDEIGSPALVDLKLFADGMDVDLQTAPSRRPDLFASRATSIYGRCPTGPISLRLQGRLPSGEVWEQQLQPEPATPSAGAAIAALWGRTRIRELEDRFIFDGNRDQELQSEIVRCSLECNVLSRFTAYVAVDHSEKVGDGGKPHKLLQPTELPEGWLPPVARLSRSELLPLRRKTEALKTSKTRKTTADPANFGKIISDQGIVSIEQLAEAQDLAKQNGCTLPQAFEALGYASHEDIARVIALSHSLPYLDLNQVNAIDDEVIQRIPESVARETGVLPYSASTGEMVVLVHDPGDLETIEKLQFILNISVRPMVASRNAIEIAINRYYGQIAGESADSMLQEFTDTAIDFTESEDIDGLADMHDHELGGAASVGMVSSDLGFIGDCDEDMSFGFAQTPPSRRVRSRGVLRKSKVAKQAAPPTAPKQPPKQPSEPAPAPVVRLISLLFTEAFQLRASHILLRVLEDGIQVVYFIEGKETLRDRIPTRLLKQILQSLKVFANIDPLVGDEYQSSTCNITVGERLIRAKVHIAPDQEQDLVMIDFQTNRVSEPEAIRQWNERFAAATQS
ncbi:MAG: VIT domain-containing protein [Planctomycetota bacterium]